MPTVGTRLMISVYLAVSPDRTAWSPDPSIDEILSIPDVMTADEMETLGGHRIRELSRFWLALTTREGRP